MNNQVINKGTDQNVVLEVHGNENRIEIQQNARIANLKIVICGNGHKVTFGENVFFNSGMIIVEDLPQAKFLSAVIRPVGVRISIAWKGKGSSLARIACCLIT